MEELKDLKNSNKMIAESSKEATKKYFISVEILIAKLLLINGKPD
jgi:hypothetical protein